MIEMHGLTKRHGPKVAVEGLTCRVQPGRVTGFLGPNGAGKSTTMRLIVGLDHPSAGTATVCGRAYRELRQPLRSVGALLDSRAAPGRTARDHLRWIAASNRIPRARVEEVLEQVRLTDAADVRAGRYSLGMAQRLGLAAALLGDPQVLILDEPMNGLDLEGVRWLRALLRNLADEGRTVLLSSHQMGEMELLADHLIVIDRGRLVADCPLPEFLAQHSAPAATVLTDEPDRLAGALRERGAVVERDGARLAVTGMGADDIGSLAQSLGISLQGLIPQHVTLEDRFSEALANEAQR